MQRFLPFLFAALMLAETAYAQPVVSVLLPDVSAAPGETVLVPVTVSDVTGLEISAFSIWLTYDPAVVQVTQVSSGPVGRSAGPAAGEPIYNASLLGQVRVAHATGGLPLAGAGVLFTYHVQFLSVGDAQFTFTKFQFNEGIPGVMVSGGAVAVNNRPSTSDRSFAIDEDVPGSVELSGSDIDNDPLEFLVVSQPSRGLVSINGSSAHYIPRRDANGTDTFTYRAFDGTDYSVPSTVRVTVNAVNDPPVILEELASGTVREGETVRHQFAASDVDGPSLSFVLMQGPQGATIHPSTGLLSWSIDFAQSGVHTFQVGVTDGFVSTLGSAVELIVLDVEPYSGSLSSANQAGVVPSGGAGEVLLEYVPELDELSVSGSFTGLSGDRFGAYLGVGAAGGQGLEVLPLQLSANPQNPGSRNGLLVEAANTFLLSNAPLPAGVTASELRSALVSGNVFVTIRSVEFPQGELRAHVRKIGENDSPDPRVLTIPSHVIVTGDPSGVSFTANWSPGVDPDNDPVRSFLGAYIDATLRSPVFWSEVTGATEEAFAVSDLAHLYDDLTARRPGNIALGGSVRLYWTLVSSDGSRVRFAPQTEMELTRGLVTGREGGPIPRAFLLRGNFPNPFNPTTVVQFDLPEDAEVVVSVSDILGRVVLTTPPQAYPAGPYRHVDIDGSSFSSGIYIYRVIARAGKSLYTAAGTMTLLK